MKTKFRQRQVSIAIAALFGSAALLAAPQILAAGKVAGKYVAGDFHNHTTCSDGSISIQKLVNKSMDSAWGLDWFVQAGHGGNGNRNCSLVEDESLATAEYPYVSGKTPNTTWADSIG
ncbi:MAG: hypothetical protein WCN85_13395, partial [Burkholderiales bacterium]